MVSPFKAPYAYTQGVVEGWESTAIGVYYCGSLNDAGQLVPFYIGKGTGDGGMRNRLLCHLREDYWHEVTHFGYHSCDTVEEANQLEASEIYTYKPKYNKIGKLTYPVTA